MSAQRWSPHELDPAFVPRLRESVVAVAVAEEAVLYEEDTGGLHQLDPIATIVCALFDGHTTIIAAVDELTRLFSAPRDRIESDVLALLRCLGSLGLLAGVDAEGADDGC